MDKTMKKNSNKKKIKKLASKYIVIKDAKELF
jgi:hypothetical protein